MESSISFCLRFLLLLEVLVHSHSFSMGCWRFLAVVDIATNTECDDDRGFANKPCMYGTGCRPHSIAVKKKNDNDASPLFSTTKIRVHEIQKFLIDS